ncbi:hypothetical protein [Ursidibacter sp. B-7004-1]
MKKLILLLLVLSANAWSMPSYEFYEEFAKSGNQNPLHEILKKDKPNGTFLGNDMTVYKFNLPRNLKNASFFKKNFKEQIFDNHSLETTWGFEMKVPNHFSMSFGELVLFTRNNFYKAFNLNSDVVKITQMKYSCTESDDESFYEMTLQNNQKLYLIVGVVGNDSKFPFTSIDFYNELVTCRDLDRGEAEKKFGNPKFK